MRDLKVHISPIECCDDCTEFFVRSDLCKAYCTADIPCREITNYEEDSTTEIPDWCPLPNESDVKHLNYPHKE